MKNTMNFGNCFELATMAEIQHYMVRKRIEGQVYMPAVDNKGIDFVIRVGNKKLVKYIEVQVKARSTRGLFSIDKFNDRDNYWFILYNQNGAGYDMYILQSKEVKQIMTENGKKTLKAKNNKLSVSKIKKYEQSDVGVICNTK
jgi:hypothetical protein